MPESSSTEYYLYDGLDLTINTHYQIINTAVPLQRVQITTIIGTTIFNGFYAGGTPACENVWRNRCSQHTFDMNASCDPCEFSVTLSGYNSTIDDAAYDCIVTTISSDHSRVNLEGNSLFCHSYAVKTIIAVLVFFSFYVHKTDRGAWGNTEVLSIN